MKVVLESEWLPVHKAARRLGVTAQQVRRLIRLGKLAYWKESPRKTWVPLVAMECYRRERRRRGPYLRKRPAPIFNAPNTSLTNLNEPRSLFGVQ